MTIYQDLWLLCGKAMKVILDYKSQGILLDNLYLHKLFYLLGYLFSFMVIFTRNKHPVVMVI